MENEKSSRIRDFASRMKAGTMQHMVTLMSSLSRKDVQLPDIDEDKEDVAGYIGARPPMAIQGAGARVNDDCLFQGSRFSGISGGKESVSFWFMVSTVLNSGVGMLNGRIFRMAERLCPTRLSSIACSTHPPPPAHVPQA